MTTEQAIPTSRKIPAAERKFYDPIRVVRSRIKRDEAQLEVTRKRLRDEDYEGRTRKDWLYGQRVLVAAIKRDEAVLKHLRADRSKAVALES